MTLKILLLLCVSSAATVSAMRISCTAEVGRSSLLGGCTDSEDDRFRIVADAIEQFIPHLQNQQCRKQLLTYADALINSSLWAVQMLDATAKSAHPVGYHLGHYDECVDLDLKRGNDNIKGKYCVADVETGSGRSRLGICTPNECNHEDVQHFVEQYLSNLERRSVVVTVTEESCVAKTMTEAAPFKYGVLGLVLWSAFATVIDLISINKGGTGGMRRILIDVFSWCGTIQKLMNSNAEVSGVHFMRVITIFFLIVHGRCHLLTDGSVTMQKWPIFDALVFLTGFLTVQRLQWESLTDTKWGCLLLCVAKWLRLMPLYAGVIAFYAVAFFHIGDGPLWCERIGREARRCGDFWWVNLSLVNNYISATGQCIAQSWYLAVTSHGFVVTVIFMHLKTVKALVGLCSLVVLLTTTIILFIWNDNARDESSEFGEFLIKSHYRLPAFILGAATAILYNHIRQFKGKTAWIHFITPFALTILGLLTLTSNRLDQESKIIPSLVSSITWSIFLGYFIIIFPLYNLEISNGTWLRSVFVPVSRLSYPALLSHNIVQLYAIGSMRTSEYVNYPRLVWMAAADILVSYASAVFLHLIVDGPAISAIRILFFNKGKITPTKEHVAKTYG